MMRKILIGGLLAVSRWRCSGRADGGSSCGKTTNSRRAHRRFHRTWSTHRRRLIRRGLETRTRRRRRPAAARRTSIIPDRSEAAYFADEQLASLPLPSKAKGSTNDITGTFYLTEDGLGLDPEQVSSFTVDLTTLTSNESRRDNRVQNDALQTSQFPTATFTASSVTGYDEGTPEGEEQTLMLTGNLDLHGVQKEVTWEVQALREGDVITALATLKDIPFSDFNITPPNIAGFVSVEDDVTLQVQIVAQRS